MEEEKGKSALSIVPRSFGSKILEGEQERRREIERI
jgi:hypothetical protein